MKNGSTRPESDKKHFLVSKTVTQFRSHILQCFGCKDMFKIDIFHPFVVWTNNIAMIIIAIINWQLLIITMTWVKQVESVLLQSDSWKSCVNFSLSDLISWFLLGRFSLKLLFKDPIEVPINDPSAGPSNGSSNFDPAKSLLSGDENVSESNVKITHPKRKNTKHAQNPSLLSNRENYSSQQYCWTSQTLNKIKRFRSKPNLYNWTDCRPGINLISLKIRNWSVEFSTYSEMTYSFSK